MAFLKQKTAALCAAVCAALCFTSAVRPTASPEPFVPAAPGTAGEVVESYLIENKVDLDNVYIGYYNLETGEEYYRNGTIYRPTASIYKVALCMYWAEKVSAGEMTWEDKLWGVRLDELVRGALEESNNDYAGIMYHHIGDGKHYPTYRKGTAYLYGLDPETAPKEYTNETNNTVQQIIYNLRLLWDNQDKYPRIIDHMLRAEPNGYFCYLPVEWPVAHKYGFLSPDDIIINDCGIIFSDPPFLLVFMSRNVQNVVTHMSRVCTLLGEYTEADAARRAAETTPAPTAAPTPAPTDTPAPTAVPAPTPAPTGTPVPAADDEAASPRWIAAPVLAAAAALAVLLFRRKRK